MTVERSPCLGLCERAPAGARDAGPGRSGPAYGGLGAGAPSARDGRTLAARAAPGTRRTARTPQPAARSRCPRPGSDALRLLHRVGVVDPRPSTTTAPTAATPPCAGPSSWVPPASSARSPTPAWSAAAAPPSPPAASGRPPASQPDHPHYLVCNADESEPGTFKDRVLMEGDPYALVEAMTIAGVRDRRPPGLPVPARRVPARPAPAGARHRAGPRARPARRRRPRPGLRLRHRDPARRGRVHLR